MRRKKMFLKIARTALRQVLQHQTAGYRTDQRTRPAVRLNPLIHRLFNRRLFRHTFKNPVRFLAALRQKPVIITAGNIPGDNLRTGLRNRPLQPFKRTGRMAAQKIHPKTILSQKAARQRADRSAGTKHKNCLNAPLHGLPLKKLCPYLVKSKISMTPLARMSEVAK